VRLAVDTAFLLLSLRCCAVLGKALKNSEGFSDFSAPPARTGTSARHAERFYVPCLD
jgi:hypothetical protein